MNHNAALGPGQALARQHDGDPQLGLIQALARELVKRRELSYDQVLALIR
jgi:hypothetical protein